MSGSPVVKWWDRSIPFDSFDGVRAQDLVEEAAALMRHSAQVCACVATWKRRISYGTGAELALDKKRARVYGYSYCSALELLGLEDVGYWHRLRVAEAPLKIRQEAATLQWGEWLEATSQQVAAMLSRASTYVLTRGDFDHSLRRVVTELDRIYERNRSRRF